MLKKEKTLFKYQTNPNICLLLSVSVLGKDLFIGEKRKIPKHQQLHDNLKFPLLPDLKCNASLHQSLFFLGAKGQLATFVLFAF